MFHHTEKSQITNYDRMSDVGRTICHDHVMMGLENTHTFWKFKNRFPEVDLTHSTSDIKL